MFKLILDIIYAIVLAGVILLIVDKVRMLLKNATYIKNLPKALEEINSAYDKRLDVILNKYDSMLEKSYAQTKVFVNKSIYLENLVKEYENYFELTNDYVIGIDNEITLLHDYVNEPNKLLKPEFRDLMNSKLSNIKERIEKMEAINNKQREQEQNRGRNKEQGKKHERER